MRKISYKVADYFVENDYVDNGDHSKIVYGMEVLKTAVIQLALISATGIIFGDFLLALFFFIGFGLVRTFAGGFHMDTIFKCSSITLVFLLVSMFVSEYIYYFGNIYIVNTIVIMASFVLYIRYAPVENYNKSLGVKEKAKFRQRSILVVMVLYIAIVCELLFITSYDSYATVLNMGMMFESLTLLPLDLGS